MLDLKGVAVTIMLLISISQLETSRENAGPEIWHKV